MASIVFKLGISSSDAITIRPNFDYSGSKRKIETNIKTRSGRGYNYKWGEYLKFFISMDYVSGQNATIVNSWWSTNTELLFFKQSEHPVEYGLLEGSGGFFLLEDSGKMTLETSYSTEVFSVMIISNNKPFSQFVKPLNYYYKGEINLEGY